MKNRLKYHLGITELTLPFEPIQSFNEEKVQKATKGLTLPSSLKYHGFDYDLVYRAKRTAVYRQMLGKLIVGFEVFLIKNDPGRVLFGKYNPSHERWPKDGDFGKTAWTCWTLDEAMLKIKTIEL